MSLAALEDFDAAGMNSILDRITIDDYETQFTGKSVADFADPAVYRRIVGDFGHAVFSSEIEFPELGARIPGTRIIHSHSVLQYVED